jgi:hypothetical protein
VPSHSCTHRASFWNRETTSGSGVDVNFRLFIRGDRQVPSTLLRNLFHDSGTAFLSYRRRWWGCPSQSHGPRPLHRTNICHASLFCVDAYVLPSGSCSWKENDGLKSHDSFLRDSEAGDSRKEEPAENRIQAGRDPRAAPDGSTYRGKWIGV